MKITIFGINITISFLFCAILSILMLCDRTGMIVPMFIAVIMHELGHLAVMKFFGCAPTEIRLIPGSVRIVTPVCTEKHSVLILVSGSPLNIIIFLIVYISYNPSNMKRLLKQIIIFYLTSFAFGGAAFALIYIVKPQEILMKNGLFLGTYPLKTVMLAAIISFIIIITAFKIVKSKISKKDMYCTVTVKINGGTVRVKAMIDTGNLLKDPLTQKPVLVIEKNSLYELLPKQILNNLENILGGDFEKIPENLQKEYLPKLKFIPFSSLGKQNGMLIGIKTEKVKIEYEDNEIYKENVVVGIYNKSLTKRGEYKALIGIEMLGDV